MNKFCKTFLKVLFLIPTILFLLLIIVINVSEELKYAYQLLNLFK